MDNLKKFIEKLFNTTVSKARCSDSRPYTATIGKPTTYKSEHFTGICDFRRPDDDSLARTYVDIYHNGVHIVTISNSNDRYFYNTVVHTIHDMNEFVALRLSMHYEPHRT